MRPRGRAGRSIRTRRRDRRRRQSVAAVHYASRTAMLKLQDHTGVGHADRERQRHRRRRVGHGARANASPRRPRRDAVGARAEIVDDINARHVNRVFLPGIRSIQRSARRTISPSAPRDAVLTVAPAQHVRAMRGAVAPSMPTASRSSSAPRASSRRQASSWATSSAEVAPNAYARGAVGPELRRRRGARLAHGVDPRLSRREPRPGASPSASARASSASTGQAT